MTHFPFVFHHIIDIFPLLPVQLPACLLSSSTFQALATQSCSTVTGNFQGIADRGNKAAQNHKLLLQGCI